jgi:hypothetical protein
MGWQESCWSFSFSSKVFITGIDFCRLEKNDQVSEQREHFSLIVEMLFLYKSTP